MNTPPDCLHPTRTVVSIDILLRTRAAMHTTIAAAAVWQFEATQNRFLYALIIISIFLACDHVTKMKKNICAFVGPPFCGAPVRPNMLNMPKSASVSLLVGLFVCPVVSMSSYTIHYFSFQIQFSRNFVNFSCNARISYKPLEFP